MNILEQLEVSLRWFVYQPAPFENKSEYHNELIRLSWLAESALEKSPWCGNHTIGIWANDQRVGLAEGYIHLEDISSKLSSLPTNELSDRTGQNINQNDCILVHGIVLERKLTPWLIWREGRLWLFNKVNDKVRTALKRGEGVISDYECTYTSVNLDGSETSKKFFAKD